MSPWQPVQLRDPTIIARHRHFSRLLLVRVLLDPPPPPFWADCFAVADVLPPCMPLRPPLLKGTSLTATIREDALGAGIAHIAKCVADANDRYRRDVLGRSVTAGAVAAEGQVHGLALPAQPAPGH